MSIFIENFGPIKEAKIENNHPLTIIIGKNNQGKSYSVELIFTRLQLQKIFESTGFSVEERKDLIKFNLRLRNSGDRHNFQLLRKGDSSFTFTAADLRLTPEKFTLKTIDQTLVAFSRILEDYLPLILEERFGVKLEGLVNANADNATIKMDLSEFLTFTFKIFKTGQIKVESSIRKEGIPLLKKEIQPLMLKIFKVLEDILKDENRRLPPFLIFDTLAIVIRKLTGASEYRYPRFPDDTRWTETIYIPAGRAGLLEGYYSVSSAYFSLATVALPRAVSMPAMPPTASVFYNLLMESTGSENKLSEIAEDLAKNVMKGEIVLKPDNRQPALKKILYRSYPKHKEPLDIDIIHAGAMVKELAGLYLAIREKIVPKSHLIVEEPEAHLHPSAQKKLARVLMKLAARGVFVTITTHSDIILREIAHLVGNYKKNKTEIVPSRDVTTILLKESELGSISEQVIIPENGVLDGLPTFDEVILELYEEETKLQSNSAE